MFMSLGHVYSCRAGLLLGFGGCCGVGLAPEEAGPFPTSPPQVLLYIIA